MNFKDKAAEFLATGCLIGYIPVAPGTVGSLAAMLPVYLLSGINHGASLVVVLVVTAVSVYVADRAARKIGMEDPGCIVIDEISGMLITFWGIPFHPLTAAAGFLLFRLLDIVKPPPIGFLDRNVRGGLGIVVDDAAAGILSNLLLRVLVDMM